MNLWVLEFGAAKVWPVPFTVLLTANSPMGFIATIGVGGKACLGPELARVARVWGGSGLGWGGGEPGVGGCKGWGL